MKIFKSKNFIGGLLIGSLITLGTISFAEEVLKTTKNQYQIYIDNQEDNINSYLINGATYLSFKDLLHSLNASFTVDKDKKLIKITSKINTDNGKEKSTIENTSIYSENQKLETITYKDYKAVIYNGTIYISGLDLRTKLGISYSGGQLNKIKLYKNRECIDETPDASDKYYIVYDTVVYLNKSFIEKYL